MSPGSLKFLGVFGLTPLLLVPFWEPRFHEGFFFKTDEHSTVYPDRDFNNVEHVADVPRKEVTKYDRAQFDRDGYILLKDMIDPALVNKFQKVAKYTRDHPSIYDKYFSYAFKEMFVPHRSPFFRDITYLSPLPRIAKSFMREGTTGVFHVTDGLWSKVPGRAAKVNQGDDTNWTLTFHTDMKEIPTDTDNCINVWFALTEISDNDAPILMIPKSHAIPRAEKRGLLKEPEDIPGLWKSMAPLVPGDVIIMNCSTLHASAALGPGSLGRMSYSMWFVGETSEQKARFTNEHNVFGTYVQHMFWNGYVEPYTKLEDTNCYTRVLPTRLPNQIEAQAHEKCVPNVYRIPLYIFGFLRNIWLYIFTDARNEVA